MIFAATLTLYVLATAVFAASAIQNREPHKTIALASLGGALLLHFAGAAYGWATVPAHTSDAISLAGCGVAAGFFATWRASPRTHVIGVFLLPLTTLAFVVSHLLRNSELSSPVVRSIFFPLHLFANVVGVAAFALAFGSSIAYLVQNRRLRSKKNLRIDGPSLETLDRISLRSIAIGFPLWTAGILTGLLFLRQESSSVVLDVRSWFAVIAWLFFGVILLLRTFIGWRGRSAAWGTALGFLCTLAVLIGYLSRGGTP